MLKFIIVICAILIFILSFDEGTPVIKMTAQEYRIEKDYGGVIRDYAKRYRMLEETELVIVIDGPCISACTLLLGLPPERICTTNRGILGFHEASYTKFGMRTGRSERGTWMVWNVYPPDVKAWIRKKGGLTEKLLLVPAKRFVRLCT